MAYRDLIAPLSYIYPELAEVPEEIKAAQIEEAFELACPSLDTKTARRQTARWPPIPSGILETFRQAGEGSVAAVFEKRRVAQKLGGALWEVPMMYSDRLALYLKQTAQLQNRPGRMRMETCSRAPRRRFRFAGRGGRVWWGHE